MGGRPNARPTATSSVPAHGARARVRASSRAGSCRSRSASAQPRAAGCDIGGFFVLALGILLATRLLPIVARALGHVRSDRCGDDLSATVLVLATRGLPSTYEEWGTAMRNEYRYLENRSARWRFSLSCTRAAALIRLRTTTGRPAPGTAGGRAFVLAGIAGAVCLARLRPAALPRASLRLRHLDLSGVLPSRPGRVRR